ncbi:MAG: alpha/beta fold hydrolase [Geodermatophilaceae bacterium]|nr:alpha/beta fold hydrolase [Geodermatophilaceae bacterium]
MPLGDLLFDVEVEGPDDGAAVLLLHGFPQSSRSWDGVAPHLLAAGHRVVRVDQRGYSPGARPPEVADYRIELLVSDAVGVLDSLGISAAHVVGHDWGSQVAWVLAASRPDRVHTLTAVSVPHPAAFGWAVRNDPEQAERSSYMALFRQPEGIAEQALLADDARRLRRLYGDLPADTVDAYVARFTAPGALTAALNWYRAMGLGQRSPIGPVQVPTTFVWSTGDVAVGRVAAERCAEYVSGDYRFLEIPDVSHWLPDQAPEAVAEAILARITG